MRIRKVFPVTWRSASLLVAVGLVVHTIGLSVEGIAQQPFAVIAGNIAPGTVAPSKTLRVPYITWGGDVATFHANGGLSTRTGSTYAKLFAEHGVTIELTPGDDFVQQVRDYVSGKTPFLRGTMRMLGQASEVLGKNPGSKPVVILQLSWSEGDHIVAREEFKSLNDLARPGRKVKIACQQGGPHVGLLYDTLAQAKVARDQVEIVWVDDLTGQNGPATTFQNDDTIDACCVITPEMIGLTGGVDSTGTGAEGTVRGAHVLNSTQQMSRSIADVYAVRADWYRANRELVDRFVAGYLKSAQEVVQLRDRFESSGRIDPAYRELLEMSQQIFGEEVLPTLEVDAHGLLLDCNFINLTGQIAFFEDAGNLSGFGPKMAAALDLATNWGYASLRSGFDPSGLSYQDIATLAGVEYRRPEVTEGRFKDAELSQFPSSELDDKTILSFTISFQPNQSVFSADQYGSEFQRALQATAQFGNAVVVIRGHSDPTKTLVDLVRAGMEKNIIKRSGRSPDYRYFIQGKPLNLEQTEQVVKLIATGAFEGKQYRPKQTAQAALNLSLARAQAVKDSLIAFAKQQRVNLDPSQLQPVGAGIADPIIPKPTNMNEARENMRVEFRVTRVPAESIQETDFDF